jgi:transposase
MPPSLADWVPDDHLARFVGDVVASLDLRAIEETYTEERGYPPYHPRMMVTLLLYAYCTGVYSSRKIGRPVVDSVAFRFLAAGNTPDFRTISEFRRRHGPALAGLFEQVLLLCRQAGLVKLGRVAIDGTKIKANASKHKAMSYGRMTQEEARLRQEVAELLRRAEAADRDEDAHYGADRRGDELPAELARRESRLQTIAAAKAALEAEARAAARADGNDPDATPPDRAQRNFTDPESKIQKTGDGFVQGYNAQLVVAEGQIIVGQHVPPAALDVQQVLPAIRRLKETLRTVPKVVLADGGYWSDANVRTLEGQGIEVFIATQRRRRGHHTDHEAAPRGRPPHGLTPQQRMERRLATRRGQRLYALRKTLVEPVFGQIKHARSFRQFLRRGVTRVGEEWALICSAHNLLKLFAVGTAR